MAKRAKQNPDEKIDMYSEDAKNLYENWRLKYDEKRAQFDEYSEKAKFRIRERPLESIGLAIGAGVLIGMSMGSALGYGASRSRHMHKHHGMCNSWNMMSKMGKGYSRNFEEEVRNKPMESLAMALGVGYMLCSAFRRK